MIVELVLGGLTAALSAGLSVQTRRARRIARELRIERDYREATTEHSEAAPPPLRRKPTLETLGPDDLMAAICLHCELRYRIAVRHAYQRAACPFCGARQALLPQITIRDAMSKSRHGRYHWQIAALDDTSPIAEPDKP